jgi:hypothetical protein
VPCLAFIISKGKRDENDYDRPVRLCTRRSMHVGSEKCLREQFCQEDNITVHYKDIGYEGVD